MAPAPWEGGFSHPPRLLHWPGFPRCPNAPRVNHLWQNLLPGFRAPNSVNPNKMYYHKHIGARRWNDGLRTVLRCGALGAGVVFSSGVRADLAGISDTPGASPTLALEPERESLWNFHGQGTVIGQGHPGIDSDYSGKNSLRTHSEFRETVSLDLMVGGRVWRGGEFYVDGLMWQGFGISDAVGVAGFPNGEAFRLGTKVPNITFSRVYLQQTFNLGGGTEAVPDDALQLAGNRDVSRVTVRVGKFSTKDVFDQNAYANDPRTQFLNWALMANGAWDFPADALGFVPGLAVDWNQSRWSERYGLFAVPRNQNGVAIDMAGVKAWSMVWELERRHTLGDHPGAVRFLTYLTRAHMGSYADAVAQADPAVDIESTRDYRLKFGFGVNLQQEIARDLGVFLRAGWNDGQTESWMFTDIDRTLSLGLSLKGAGWNRPDDTVGLAGVVNGLSAEHRAFLESGGYGITVGDGRLSHGPEEILETYYDFQVCRQFRAAVDCQFVNHPAYNRDRGPVWVLGARLHCGF